ncbi:hypothetical protein T31B1_16565 [Salinisphaera sp. T31B1]
MNQKFFGFKSFRSSGSYWERRYASDGNSGPGSYGRLADFKARVINEFVANHNISRVIEFGCGDGNQLALAEYPYYVGVDVSGTAVNLCKSKFKNDPSKSFLVLGDYDGRTADLALSLDVIYHLIEDEVFDKYMRQLFNASEAYVIVYSSNYEWSPANANHVRHRKFTDFIAKEFPQWQLIQHLQNDYPTDGAENDGSFAEFYIYRCSK